ncbi:hypothetical protein [Pseudoxanthomonas sp. SE1]|uniref:hypothetical protein n=1 Tax=Pseudoxanthomonas sp. SE1 TaxID=1664560 RepID=UPI00240DCD8E|nr:hypothetical protein [Pseudoxanthomonas sp. SE1]WFC43265.1 hypothetical protein OY559_07065 [Pseudoxanthomonas sp. SE1]
MTKISELPRPGTVRPWWMLPVVNAQGANARLPLSHLGNLPRGAIALSLASFIADIGSTSDADPGAGVLRWNNAIQADSTMIFIDDVDVDSGDHSALWTTLSAGGKLYLYDAGDLDVWQEWDVLGAVDAAGYGKISVSHFASAGTFSDDAAVVVTIQQADVTSGEHIPAIRTESASYTPVLEDRVVQMDVASANNFTVPPNSSVAFPVGIALEVWQQGAGQTTIVADSGVTILYDADDTLKLKGQNAGCSLRKVATNTWRLIGKMEAA